MKHSIEFLNPVCHCHFEFAKILQCQLFCIVFYGYIKKLLVTGTPLKYNSVFLFYVQNGLGLIKTTFVRVEKPVLSTFGQNYGLLLTAFDRRPGQSGFFYSKYWYNLNIDFIAVQKFSLHSSFVHLGLKAFILHSPSFIFPPITFNYSASHFTPCI